MLRSCCFGRRIGDGLLWHSALKPHATGEFSIAVVQANSNLEDQSQVYTSPSATYVGVYDGHGGPEASRFVNHHLFLHLQKFSKEQGGLSTDVIKRAFNAAEEDFTRLVKISLPTNPKIASVGSCCLVGAISDGKLREVEALHPDDSPVVVYCRGVWRIKGIIQVSRSIGDVYLKKPEFHRDPIFQQYGNYVPMKRPLMSAEPSIVTRKLRQEDKFIIFASDGLWEQLSDDEAVQIVSKYPRAGIAKRLVAAAIQEAAKKREVRYKDIKKIERGIRRHFHDDITVVVIYLDHQTTFSKPKHKQGAVGSTTPPIDIYSHNSDEAVGSSSDKIFPNEEPQAKVLN
ncbi:[pyruvate dehydrogenase (acetyl-transferring)]-phosphatase [Salvia divinorum]|uniref:protein-serine/threonine phosphatase n=1 Tax=Salvia divinorum TaxID=28513 RepID=A0ABD1FS91_SALDI